MKMGTLKWALEEKIRNLETLAILKTTKKKAWLVDFVFLGDHYIQFQGISMQPAQPGWVHAAVSPGVAARERYVSLEPFQNPDFWGLGLGEKTLRDWRVRFRFRVEVSCWTAVLSFIELESWGVIYFSLSLSLYDFAYRHFSWNTAGLMSGSNMKVSDRNGMKLEDLAAFRRSTSEVLVFAPRELLVICELQDMVWTLDA